MSKLRGVFILAADAYRLIYPPEIRSALGEYVEIISPPLTRDSIQEPPAALREAQVILSGWGAPLIDADLLDAMPDLEAIFYGAGSVGYCMTPAVWERGIVVTSSIAANAIPVAEYTMAAIIMSLKNAWQFAQQTRQERQYPDRNVATGCYGSVVGLISLGSIARALLKKLSVCDFRVKVYDPFLSASEAQTLGVQRATLDELFRTCDVVSLHAPSFPETRGMITGEHLSMLKPGATFINTARAELVCQEDMIHIARNRPDLQFVLDVATPEPPDPQSPLFELSNVLLTPHIAGSVGHECGRMGQYMVDELRRYVLGQPLHWAITPESAANSTHRIPHRPAGKPRALQLTISKLQSGTTRPSSTVGEIVEAPMD